MNENTLDFYNKLKFLASLTLDELRKASDGAVNIKNKWWIVKTCYDSSIMIGGYDHDNNGKKLIPLCHRNHEVIHDLFKTNIVDWAENLRLSKSKLEGIINDIDNLLKNIEAEPGTEIYNTLNKLKTKYQTTLDSETKFVDNAQYYSIMHIEDVFIPVTLLSDFTLNGNTDFNQHEII